MHQANDQIFSTVLTAIPQTLRDPLVASFNAIVMNFRESRWEPSELNGGKLCEIAYSILRGHVDGSFPQKPEKPRDMVQACRALEQADKAKFPQSVRITIPRLLIAIYEVRNNRGVGHAGAEVDPNHMDAVLVLTSAKWVMAELVRVFHRVNIKEASDLVELLIDRTIPIVWEVGSSRRVLNTNLSLRNKTLLLLYSSAGPLPDTELQRWLEQAKLGNFRRDSLDRLHDDKLIEYDRNSKLVYLSPTGRDFVEQAGILDFKAGVHSLRMVS